MGMGAVTSYGRRTTTIAALNIAGKGFTAAEIAYCSAQ
jgi:hypothetical protein